MHLKFRGWSKNIITDLMPSVWIETFKKYNYNASLKISFQKPAFSIFKLCPAEIVKASPQIFSCPRFLGEDCCSAKRQNNSQVGLFVEACRYLSCMAGLFKVHLRKNLARVVWIAQCRLVKRFSNWSWAYSGPRPSLCSLAWARSACSESQSYSSEYLNSLGP